MFSKIKNDNLQIPIPVNRFDKILDKDKQNNNQSFIKKNNWYNYTGMCDLINGYVKYYGH